LPSKRKERAQNCDPKELTQIIIFQSLAVCCLAGNAHVEHALTPSHCIYVWMCPRARMQQQRTLPVSCYLRVAATLHFIVFTPLCVCAPLCAQTETATQRSRR